jgi:hypothetical protein
VPMLMGFALSTSLPDLVITSWLLMMCCPNVFGNLCLCEIGVPASAVNIN